DGGVACDRAGEPLAGPRAHVPAVRAGCAECRCRSGESDDRGECESEANGRPRDACQGWLGKERQEYESGEREPDDAADRCHAADEGEHERELLESGEAVALASEQEKRAGCEPEEERGLVRGRARAPLVDEGAQRRVREQPVVVAAEREAVGRSEEAGDRRG